MATRKKEKLRKWACLVVCVDNHNRLVVWVEVRHCHRRRVVDGEPLEAFLAEVGVGDRSVNQNHVV